MGEEVNDDVAKAQGEDAKAYEADDKHVVSLLELWNTHATAAGFER